MRPAAFAPAPEGARLPPLWAQPLIGAGLLLVPVAPTLALGALGLAVLDFQAEPAQALFGDWRGTLVIMVAYGAMVIGGVLLWTRWGERRPLSTLGLRGRLGRREALWLVVGLAWSAALTGLFALLPGGEAATEVSSASPALKWLPLFAALLLLLAFMEEVLCRGWLLSALTARVGAVWAMALSGLVFAALHVLPWELADPSKLMSFLGYAALGAGFCALALHAGQLWTPTAFHLGYNTVFAALFLAQPDATPAQLWQVLESEPRGLTDTVEAVAWLAANLVLSGWFVWLWKRGKEKPPAANPSAGGSSGETVS